MKTNDELEREVDRRMAIKEIARIKRYIVNLNKQIDALTMRRTLSEDALTGYQLQLKELENVSLSGVQQAVRSEGEGSQQGS